MNAFLNALMPTLIDALGALCLIALLVLLPWSVWLPDPSKWLANFYRRVAIKLTPARRSASDQRVRGAIILVLLLNAAGVMGYYLDKVLAQIPQPFVAFAPMLLLALLLNPSRAFRALWSANRHLLSLPRAEAPLRLGRASIRGLVIALSDRIMIALTIYIFTGWVGLAAVFALIAILEAADHDAVVLTPAAFYVWPQALYRLISYPLVLPGALAAVLITQILPGAKGGARAPVPRGQLLGLRGIMTNMVARRLGLAIEPRGGVLKTDWSRSIDLPVNQGKDDKVVSLRTGPGQQALIDVSPTRTIWIGAADGRARISAIDIRRLLVGWWVTLLILAGALLFALQGISWITGRLPVLA